MQNCLNPLLRSCFLLLAMCLPFSAAAEVQSGRAVEIEAEAEVTAVNLDTRQVTLKMENGESLTVTAPEAVVSLDTVSVGDMVRTAYVAAVEAEVREPTEEELANPWVVLSEAGAGEVAGQPTAGAARVIRAVCTVEGMNRLLGTATLLDSNGGVHVVGDVEPAKMEGVTLGQTVVVEFAEALAITLEHVARAE